LLILTSVKSGIHFAVVLLKVMLVQCAKFHECSVYCMAFVMKVNHHFSCCACAHVFMPLCARSINSN